MEDQDDITQMLQRSLDTEVARIEGQFDKLWDRQAPLIALGQGVQDALTAKKHDYYQMANQYSWLTEEAKAQLREKLAAEAAELVRLGIDFKLLINKMQSHPLLKSHWEKIEVLMKLTEPPK